MSRSTVLTRGAKPECDLRELRRGAPGITRAFGLYLAEAAAICLESRRHNPGVCLRVNGAFNCTPVLFWVPTNEQTRRCHNDLQCATEYGAYGVALVMVKHLTGKVVVERSRKGTGFDYWLGERDDEMFQQTTRLEVSGILVGDHSKIDSRVATKVLQTARSDGQLPAYVVIVEFGGPVSQFTIRL
jgi:hypothetical protein